MPKRIIAVVGVTGNQGGSVADVFIDLPDWHVRGITRDTTKASSKEWQAKGVEMVQADLDDTASLVSAFSGATAVFGVTDFWQHLKNPANHTLAARAGRLVNEICYELEVKQGQNIVDAAAATDSLERFIMSSLSSSKKRSGGGIQHNFHFDSKAVAMEYLGEKYADLQRKTSIVHAASFMENYRQMVRKQEDGSFLLGSTMVAETRVPFVHPRKDIGHFVKALLDTTPGKDLAGQGDELSWQDLCTLLTKLSGVQFNYTRYPREVLEKNNPIVGLEIADMFQYIEDYGYYGGDSSITFPDQLDGKIPCTTYETFLRVDLPSFLNSLA